MAERPKDKAPARTARKGQRLFHGPGPWPGAAEALNALARAWTVTMIATALLAAALAIAPFWDTAIYLRALQDTLRGDPALASPGDDVAAPALAGPMRAGDYRLQLRHGGRVLAADACSEMIALHRGASWNGGACQLWRLEPQDDGWSRLQLMQDGRYLAAGGCSGTNAADAGRARGETGCDLWRLVRAHGSLVRLQSKDDGQYLAAAGCTTGLGFRAGSSREGGACQLWRLVPASMRWH